MKRLQGSLTVFFSLLLSVFLLFFTTCIKVVELQVGQNRAATSFVMANESILADYNKELWEMYHIFALDKSYEGKGDQMMSIRAQQYMSENLNENHGIYAVKQMQIGDFTYLEGLKCQVLKHQIREYMKYQMPKELVTNLSDLLSKKEENNIAANQAKEDLLEQEKKRNKSKKVHRKKNQNS